MGAKKTKTSMKKKYFPANLFFLAGMVGHASWRPGIGYALMVFSEPSSCTKKERALGSRMITRILIPATLALRFTFLSLIDSLQALSDVTLHAVFQGLIAQLSSLSQEKNTLLSELIALQDNFIQEQSTTTVLTVLIFLTDACVLQLIDRPFYRLIRDFFDTVAAILNREGLWVIGGFNPFTP